MPTPWTATETYTAAGRWMLVFTAPGRPSKDVTNFRSTPTLIENYSFADPFGDALLNLRFPQITGYDDLASNEIASWFTDESNVDLYWVPAIAGSTVINPVTGLTDKGLGTPEVLWEGFVGTYDIEETDAGSMLIVACQGALFQGDRHLAKPTYPPRPRTYESMMGDQFSPTYRPNLRTKPLRVDYPSGWTKTQPGGKVTAYTPMGAAPGEKVTGYSSRDTGTWDRSLTGFCQSLLAVMFTQEDCGVTPGNQWAIRKYAGRQPVLEVRDRFREPDFELWYGQLGVKTGRLTHDSTQKTNVIYGEGTGTDGVSWRNAVISADGSRTDYAPLSFDPAVYPIVDNPLFDPDRMVYESYQRYGSGFDQSPATLTAEKTRARDSDPGWTGEVVLSIDPSPTLARWQVRAGMTFKLKGFAGSGAEGINFHIAEVVANPEQGSISMKVDTKYRDLLTLEEVIARTRDPLTPSKMLQVNRRTVMIEDIMAPWDYNAGSGYMPRQARYMLKNNPDSTFPWTNVTTKFPPKTHPEYYVRVKGKASTPHGRWAFFPILTAQKGTIRKIEMCAYDKNGNRLAARFHLSLYYTNVTLTAMPMKDGQHSPFFTGAFEENQPNGNPWPAGNFFAPDPSIIIGWGNSVQPAGYSPGSFTGGNPLTGKLVDEATWSFDNINNPNFNRNAKAGQTQPRSAITIYGALYTDYPANVYFLGRMYRAEPGT
jgi:hypothetical protein